MRKLPRRSLLSPAFLPVALVFMVSILFVFSAGCLSWPASGPVTQPTTAIPEPATTPATGSLEVSSDPARAEIYLDRVYYGTTPAVIPDVPAGTHALELRIRDTVTWTTNVEVVAGQKTSINPRLLPITTLTTVPTTRETIVPGTARMSALAGCWEYESQDNVGIHDASLELLESGAGWMFFEFSEPGKLFASNSSAISWEFDTDLMEVVIKKANPSESTTDTGKPWKWVLSYDQENDILDAGEEESGEPYHLKRVKC
jgi:hypothetical protein